MGSTSHGPLDIFIPDIHGDPEALRKTLIKANLATSKSGKLIFRDPDLHELVFAGDYIDRGPANLETLDLLLSIREEFKSAIFEVGNHDLAMMQVLTHPRNPRWIYEWMNGGGDKVLEEVVERFRLKLLQPVKDVSPLQQREVLNPNDAKYLSLFEEFWKRKLEQNEEWQRYDYPASLAKMEELVFSGEYRVLFENMKIAHRIGSTLTVHAGMNKKGLSLGLDRLNALYTLALRRKDFTFLYNYNWQEWKAPPHAPLSSLFCMTKPLPPKRQPGPLIDWHTAEELQAQHIKVLLHGHAVLESGVQECNDAFGIADMNGDVCISSGHTANKTGKSRAAYIQYDCGTGQFTAENDITGPLNFGKLHGDQYEFPE